jgi:hypothetical protein
VDSTTPCTSTVHKHGIRGEPDPYAEEPQRAPGDPARDWRASRNHRDPDEYERQLTSNLEPLAARRVGVDRESRSRGDRSCGGTDAQGGRRKGDRRPSPKEQKQRDQHKGYAYEDPGPPGRCVDAPELAFKRGSSSIDDERNHPVGTIDPTGQGTHAVVVPRDAWS